MYKLVVVNFDWDHVVYVIVNENDEDELMSILNSGKEPVDILDDIQDSGLDLNIPDVSVVNVVEVM